MKLETKYGVLEGTVEEFKELLEGKVNRSWLFTSKGYKIVNKDIDSLKLTKGTVIKHVIANQYENTLGEMYIVHDNDVDDCIDIGIEDLFNNSVKIGTLLKHGGYKPTYWIVNNDNARCRLNSGVRVPKGVVLEKLSTDWYVDAFGNNYVMSNEDLDYYKEYKNKKELYRQGE